MTISVLRLVLGGVRLTLDKNVAHGRAIWQVFLCFCGHCRLQSRIKRWRFMRCKCCSRACRRQSSFRWAMLMLAALISPGDFGFSDWAYAAEAPSTKVPIMIHENDALIILPPLIFG